MELTFYKEETNRWYVYLPEWEGSKADLEMVCGADTMLDELSNNGNEIKLDIYEDETWLFEDQIDLVLTKTNELDNLLGGGAMYKSNKADYNIWLCDVTKFVFKKFPRRLYINIIK